MNNEIKGMQQYIPIAAATAGTPATVLLTYVGDGKAELVYLGFAAIGAVTSNDTNYATFTATIGATTVATESTTTSDTGDIAAFATEPLVLSSTGDATLSQGESVKVVISKVASGVAITGALVAGFRRVRAD